MNLLDAGASRQLSRAAARAGQRGSGGDGARRGDGADDGGYRRDGAGKFVIGEDDEELRRPGRKGAKGGKRGRDGEDGGGYASDDSDFDDLRDVADLSYAMRKEGAKSVQVGRSTANRSVGARSDGVKSAGGKSVGGRSDGGKSAGGRSTASAGGGRKGPSTHSGDRFKPKKSNTGGDTKGKAAVEPYAYWQFDRKMLNRRKSKQVTASKSLTTVGAAPVSLRSRLHRAWARPRWVGGRWTALSGLLCWVSSLSVSLWSRLAACVVTVGLQAVYRS
jgi:ribosomal RNA-processing protein 12